MNKSYKLFLGNLIFFLCMTPFMAQEVSEGESEVLTSLSAGEESLPVEGEQSDTALEKTLGETQEVVSPEVTEDSSVPPLQVKNETVSPRRPQVKVRKKKEKRSYELGLAEQFPIPLEAYLPVREKVSLDTEVGGPTDVPEVDSKEISKDEKERLEGIFDQFVSRRTLINGVLLAILVVAFMFYRFRAA